MILQSLYALYNRLAEDPDNGLPKPGYSLQNITFRIVLQPDGTLVEIQDARQQLVEINPRTGKEKKSIRALPLLVIGQSKPPGQGINPCFLWDNAAYMLGFKPDDPKPERTQLAFTAFTQKHLALEQEIQSQDFSAVCRFLESWNPESATDHPILTELGTGFGVFQISPKTQYVHQTPAIRNWWNLQTQNEEKTDGSFCLITGDTSPTALTHDPAIKGVAGAQSSGAKLVSFNLKAVESFSKEQGSNSPVSETAAFAYCNALNWLLARKERRFHIGDAATTVFWTDEPTPAETLLPWMMSGVPDAEDQTTKNRVHEVLLKIAQGTLARDELGDPGVPYYILGLSSNASRLSVRFWHTGTLGELVTNLKLHFEHLDLVRQWDETNSKNPEPLTPTSYQLLRQTSRDVDGIPPLLGGALIRSILLGLPYPNSLINAVLNRIRAEREVSYLKAAILKAWLIRNHKQSITTMLDETNTNSGYRLGRLFAVLEKAQQDALPGLNATIRDRFYASASATPRAVFGRLLRTYQHHLGKLEVGAKINREKQTQEILSTLSDFPAHLNLLDQSQFALGYYHQRKDFFTKKETTPEPEIASA